MRNSTISTIVSAYVSDDQLKETVNKINDKIDTTKNNITNVIYGLNTDMDIKIDNTTRELNQKIDDLDKNINKERTLHLSWLIILSGLSSAELLMIILLSIMISNI